MKKILKALSLCFVVLFALCFGLTGCIDLNKKPPDDPEEPENLLPDYDLRENELSVVITGWLAHENPASQEQLTLLKESGISTLFCGAAGSGVYAPSVSQPTEEDYAIYHAFAENGLSCYIAPGSYASGAQYISNFSDYAAVLGFFMDEPNKGEIDQLASQISAFNANGAGKNLYVNLFPSFSTEVIQDFGVGQYPNYLRYYCDNVLEKLTVGEKWLSADRYPLTFDTNGNKTLDVGWLQDVEAVATVACEYEDVKTNFFIQTMPYGGELLPAGVQGSRARVPSYEDIRMQEYALLAFGYDSISLFCYMSPAVGVEFTETQLAMLDRNGEPTDIYYSAQKANSEILAIDHVVLQFDWQGVFTNDGGETTRKGDRGRTQNPSFSNLRNRMPLSSVACLNAVTTSADTLFGYFIDSADNEAIFAVNYNETTLGLSDTITLEFDPSYSYTKAQCYVGGEKVIYDITDNSLSITLGVGEGVFVIPY